MPKINTKHWRQSPQNCRFPNADVTQTVRKRGVVWLMTNINVVVDLCCTCRIFQRVFSARPTTIPSPISYCDASISFSAIHAEKSNFYSNTWILYFVMHWTAQISLMIASKVRDQANRLNWKPHAHTEWIFIAFFVYYERFLWNNLRVCRKHLGIFSVQTNNAPRKKGPAFFECVSTKHFIDSVANIKKESILMKFGAHSIIQVKVVKPEAVF